MNTAFEGRGLWEEVLELVRRRRPGYSSFCVSVDLLGVRRMLSNNPPEAGARLNDLQIGLAEATILFPGGGDYRACFLGDSWFIVREVSPEQDPDTLWPAFCGHLFALTSIVRDMKDGLGNPGIRAVAARGSVTQIELPDAWRDKHLRDETKHWFVLTGADQALVKSEQAQRAGKKGGFFGNLFWFEVLQDPGTFWGTPFRKFSPLELRRPDLYAAFYERMRQDHTREAMLPAASGE